MCGEAAMLKLPRTIRLDPSDTFVFERAAEPGEWAVSGAFVFFDCDPATLAQKQRVALRSGFLGIDSLGWSTLAIVTEATDAGEGSRHGEACRATAAALRRAGCGGGAACRGSRDRVCGIALRSCAANPARRAADGGGRRTPRALSHIAAARSGAPAADTLHAQARAFTFHEVEGGDEDAEQVDLRGLIEADRK